MQRLSIIKHNVCPSDGYELADAKDTALWVLVSDEDICADGVVQPPTPLPPNPATPSTVEEQRYNNILTILESVARAVANPARHPPPVPPLPPPLPPRNAAAGAAANNPPLSGPLRPTSSLVYETNYKQH